MKIPIFHGGGKEFKHVTAQVFWKKPVKPKDSGCDYGYSVQLNTSNADYEVDPASNKWVPRDKSNATEFLAFQQNVLQVGQQCNDKIRNNMLYWNRNGIANPNAYCNVEFGCTIMPDSVWQAVQHFGEKEWQCLHLEMDMSGMLIRLIDNVAEDGSVGLKTIYEAKSYPQRYVPNSMPTKLIDVPIVPWTTFQVRIVGFGNLSHSTFDADAKFGVNIQADSEFEFALIDSTRSFNENYAIYSLPGIKDTYMTAETSNLSCSLQHNGWKGKGLYYECFV